jgi:hypothetical protein
MLDGLRDVVDEADELHEVDQRDRLGHRYREVRDNVPCGPFVIATIVRIE